MRIRITQILCKFAAPQLTLCPLQSLGMPRLSQVNQKETAEVTRSNNPLPSGFSSFLEVLAQGATAQGGTSEVSGAKGQAANGGKDCKQEDSNANLGSAHDL